MIDTEELIQYMLEYGTLAESDVKWISPTRRGTGRYPSGWKGPSFGRSDKEREDEHGDALERCGKGEHTLTNPLVLGFHPLPPNGVYIDKKNRKRTIENHDCAVCGQNFNRDADSHEMVRTDHTDTSRWQKWK